MRYSLILVFTLQLTTKHKGINNAVRIKKNIDIPSIPKLKLKFKYLLHVILVRYWKCPIDLLKLTQRYIEKTKEKLEKINAVCFKCNWFHEGMTTKASIPASGDNKVQNNILFM